MNNTSILALILFGLLLANAGANMIPSICTDLARLDKQTVNYDFCVSKLGSDPHISNSTVKELAIFSIQLDVSKAEEISSTINKVLNKSKKIERFDEPFTIPPLKECSLAYSKIPANLKYGLDVLNEGKFDKAKIAVTTVVSRATACGYDIKAVKGDIDIDVVKKMNDDFCKSIGISLGFTNLLPIIN